MAIDVTGVYRDPSGRRGEAANFPQPDIWTNWVHFGGSGVIGQSWFSESSFARKGLSWEDRGLLPEG
jgi:hypothetical protein